MLGLGFLFRPRLMARWHRAYSSRVLKIQKRFIKAHRATGLFFVNVGLVMLLSYFYPVWIYHSFLFARIVVGTLFPSMFAPTQTVTLPFIPTVWI